MGSGKGMELMANARHCISVWVLVGGALDEFLLVPSVTRNGAFS
jgi:hypothetical protein